MFVRAHQRATICRFKPHWASPSGGPGLLFPTLVLCKVNMYHVCISPWCKSRSFLMCECVGVFSFVFSFFLLYDIWWCLQSTAGSVTFYHSPNAHAFILEIQISLILLNLSHSSGWFCIKRTLMEKQRLWWWIYFCFGSGALPFT